MNNKLQRNKKDNSSFNKIVMVVQIYKKFIWTSKVVWSCKIVNVIFILLNVILKENIMSTCWRKCTGTIVMARIWKENNMGKCVMNM